MASTDPFMEIAKGRFPLSENTGAARYWANSDGVPRPDRAYWWLALISIVFGLIGADHFWLRSPKTGFLKMITMGGFGLWWLWDIAQILTEKERIVTYGMSTPFDLTTGIAQGMITDQETHYKSKVNYGLWAWSTIFGFIGFDSLFVMKNMGQGLRKLMEGGLVLLSLGIFLGFAVGGLPHSFFGWIGAIFKIAFAVTCLALFGTSVGVTWTKTITKAMGTPENLMQEGIVFSELDDKQVNATVTSMLLASAGNGLNREENLKTIKEQIKILKYGSILPQEFQDMFSVEHMSRIKPDALPPSEIDENATNPTAAVAAYAAAPGVAAAHAVRETLETGAKLVAGAVAPPTIPIREMLDIGVNLVKKKLNNPSVQDALLGAATGAVTSVAPKGVGAVLDAVMNPSKAADKLIAGAATSVGNVASTISDATGAAQGAVTGVTEVANKATEMVGTSIGAAKKASEIAGAVTGVSERTTRLASIMRDIRRIAPGISDSEIARYASTIHKQKPNITTAELDGLAQKMFAQQAQLQSIPASSPNSDAAYRAEQQMKEMGRLPKPVMVGGARTEPLSLEGKLMGAATIALIGGGAVKFIIDNLMPE